MDSKVVNKTTWSRGCGNFDIEATQPVRKPEMVIFVCYRVDEQKRIETVNYMDSVTQKNNIWIIERPKTFSLGIRRKGSVNGVEKPRDIHFVSLAVILS